MKAASSTVLRRWPTAVGLASAALILALGADPEVLAIVVLIATSCYLAAAALDRPWISWAWLPLGGVIVSGSERVGLPWLVTTGVAALVLLTAGLVTRAPGGHLAAQALALAGFGALAGAAMLVTPRVGVVMAGLVLAAHAGWDLVHYRRDVVVPRSLSEFCMALDLPLGLTFVVLGLAG
jgi:hypothetical protein